MLRRPELCRTHAGCFFELADVCHGRRGDRGFGDGEVLCRGEEGVAARGADAKGGGGGKGVEDKLEGVCEEETAVVVSNAPEEEFEVGIIRD